MEVYLVFTGTVLAVWSVCLRIEARRTNEVSKVARVD